MPNCSKSKSRARQWGFGVDVGQPPEGWWSERACSTVAPRGRCVWRRLGRLGRYRPHSRYRRGRGHHGKPAPHGAALCRRALSGWCACLPQHGGAAPALVELPAAELLSAAGAGWAAAHPLPRPAPQRRHAAAWPRHPPKIVSELLGHSQIGITLDLYSHVTATMQQEAVRALEGLFGSQFGSQKGATEDQNHSSGPVAQSVRAADS
jgi:hypothetical protein